MEVMKDLLLVLEMDYVSDYQVRVILMEAVLVNLFISDLDMRVKRIQLTQMLL